MEKFPENLFEEDSIAVISAKLHATETFLTLTTKDCKFQDFMREILVVILKVIPCEAGSLLELDTKNNSLFFRATVGQSSDDVSKFVIPVGKGIVGHVAESLQPFVVNDARDSQMHLKSIDDVVGFTTRTLAAVPIAIRGKLFGVIELLNRVGDEGFTKEDLELLNYCAAKAAKTIEIRLMFAAAMSAGEHAA